MVNPGQTGQLTVSRSAVRATFLDGGKHGEVMLAGVTNVSVGDTLEVFVYVDSDGTLMATTTIPKVLAGQVASLEVVALTDSGAFLDWGQRSDLFMPRSEQLGDMRVGSKCVALAMLDEHSQRMIATARLYQHLPDLNNGTFTHKQEVSLLVCQRTELGFKAVVNGTHLGMLYHNEIFSPLQVGDQHQGYIKVPRDDDKIDVVLQKAGRAALGDVENAILKHLRSNKGVSTLTDKSPPAEIYRTFGVSKKVFKQAIGALYKARLISVSKEKIELI